MIIIGMLVTLPFNYIYGISGIEVDAVWVFVGIVMIVFGVYLLKKQFFNRISLELSMGSDEKTKAKKDHEHFVNDDPTEFPKEDMEDLVKKAVKKFKSLQ